MKDKEKDPRPALEPSAFTVLWTNDRCRSLAKAGDVGKPLRVLFGGDHLSTPSLTRFGVKVGDLVYPIRVHRGELHIIARMQVATFLSCEEYFHRYLELGESYRGLHLWDLEKKLAEEQPALGHLLPYGCIHEVALGENGTLIRFDRPIPGELLAGIRYRSQRRERAIRYVEEGKLKSSVSIQGGFYRLSPDSATMFERLLFAEEPRE